MRVPALRASFIALLLALPARAQVNVEPVRRQISERGFALRLKASVASYAGNTEGVVFGGAGLLGLKSARNLAFFDASGDYSKLGGSVSVAKWYAHLRHNYAFEPWLLWEEFAQIESDRFRRVSLRELIGTGPRLGVLLGERFELFVGTSYMLEHTELSTSAAPARSRGWVQRWNNYVALTWRIDDRITLSSVTYAQPRFEDFSDVKLLNVSRAVFEVTKILQSALDATTRYESVVPSDVAPADLELKSSLQLAF